MTTKKKQTQTASPEMDAWTMSISILIGLKKAADQTRAEYDDLAAKEGEGMGRAQLSVLADLCGSLQAAHRSLDADLWRLGRSAGLPLPEDAQ